MDSIKAQHSPLSIKLNNCLFVEANAGLSPIESISQHPEVMQFIEAVPAGFLVIYTYHKNKKILVMQKSYTDPTFKTLSNAITMIWNDCQDF
ncbi:hypothetical protein [Helicobacter kayseriensis]|uniref:hypothetical protein n=1 Tax=Helicobacter kayseriensis TaxID=2905877 RepID=UPI001E29FD87|nr:hypothetical protein [Helicobacter kayseriensis]MCE3047294.1 hypothetical protein [Helicobacter kayseriensis]MCE3048665.1 hypothetical protein [Helicobacter kayseriensis]